MAKGSTLWSWPGQNPMRYRDPSGRNAVLGLGFEMGDFALAVGTAAISLANQIATALGAVNPVVLGVAATAAVGTAVALATVQDFTSTATAAELAAHPGKVLIGWAVAGMTLTFWVPELDRIARIAKKRPRGDNVCRCTFRYGWDAPPGCPDRVYADHPDIGTCQEMAKITAPAECRAYYGHCGFFPN
jgi:hypothetical protein